MALFAYTNNDNELVNLLSYTVSMTSSCFKATGYVELILPVLEQLIRPCLSICLFFVQSAISPNNRKYRRHIQFRYMISHKPASSKMKLELSTKGLSSLEKEVLSPLLKHKGIPSRISLLSLMIIRIIAIVVPILQLYSH
jgi:hypothetical protein